jgi:hypothetical protein
MCPQNVVADSSGPIHFSDGVTLLSPVNATYNVRTLLLNYTFGIGWIHYSLNYNIDDIYSGPMPYTVINGDETHVVYHTKGSVQLPELSEGSHKLTISLEADFNPQDIRYYSDTIYFTINSGAPSFLLDTTAPNVTIQSPQNNTIYSTGTQIPLVFSLSKSTLNMIYLLLDSNRTVIPLQNATLGPLQPGQHNLTLIAPDNAGNIGVSQFIQFTIAYATPLEIVKPVDAAKPLGLQATVVVLVVVFVVLVFVVISLRRRHNA